MPRRYVIIVVVAAAVVGVGTWAGLARDGSQAAAPEPDLTLELQQYRVDEPLHQVRLTVSNNEPRPVVIESAQLVSPDFDLVPPERHDSELPPGGRVRVSLQTTYGPARCDGEVRTTAGPASARLWVRSADGDVDEFVFPLADPHEYLHTLLRRDCELQKINSSVDVAFTDSWEAVTSGSGKPAVRTGVRLRLIDPRATVDVLEMIGSVIFNLNAVPAREPLAHVDSSIRQTEMVVEFTNNRCDPHAVAEAGHGFLFQFWFSVDGSEPISRTFSPEDAGIGALRGLIERGCGLNG